MQYIGEIDKNKLGKYKQEIITEKVILKNIIQEIMKNMDAT